MIDLQAWASTIDAQPMTKDLVHNLFGVCTVALDLADKEVATVEAAGAWQANVGGSMLSEARQRLIGTALVISNHDQDPVSEADAGPFRDAVRQAIIATNAADEAAATQVDTDAAVPQIAADAVADAPNVIGNSLGKAAAGLASIGGNFSAAAILAFLKGLLTDPIGLLLVGAVGYVAYRRYLKK